VECPGCDSISLFGPNLEAPWSVRDAVKYKNGKPSVVVEIFLLSQKSVTGNMSSTAERRARLEADRADRLKRDIAERQKEIDELQAIEEEDRLEENRRAEAARRAAERRRIAEEKQKSEARKKRKEEILEHVDKDEAEETDDNEKKKKMVIGAMSVEPCYHCKSRGITCMNRR